MMQEFKKLLKSEIPDFLAKGKEFQSKNMSMMEFKHASGGMGVYAQRGGDKFMIRLRFLSGVLTVEQLQLVYDYAKKYGLERLHFTTRQTIQLHDMDIEEICELMEDALDHDIYTRGGGGNYPRNVSLSPMSGVAADEVFDVTPFAIMVNEHFISKITSYRLPRKLKVSFSNNDKDTGNATINDLGFLAVEENGKPYFKMYFCGGLGNNPKKSLEYDELVRPEDVLYHVEAMVKFFMEEGDYQNRSKARTRYIPMRMGDEVAIARYKECYEEVKRSGKLKELSATLSYRGKETERENEAKGAIKQGKENLYTVIIHPRGGLLSTKDCKTLLEFFEKVPDVELRLDMDESMFVRNLTKEQAEELMALTESYSPQVPVWRSVSCIGVPTCQIGICESQRALYSIFDYLLEHKNGMERLPVMHISGCNNSCGRHQVANLGFAGRRKKVDGVLVDAYEVFAGGCLGRERTTLGDSYGVIAGTKLPEFVSQLAMELEKEQTAFDNFYRTEGFRDLVKQFES